jgi:hypothetical protein
MTSLSESVRFARMTRPLQGGLRGRLDVVGQEFLDLEVAVALGVDDCVPVALGEDVANVAQAAFTRGAVYHERLELPALLPGESALIELWNEVVLARFGHPRLR